MKDKSARKKSRGQKVTSAAEETNREHSGFYPLLPFLQSLEERGGEVGCRGAVESRRNTFPEKVCVEESADEHEASFQETVCREDQMISLIH